MIAASGKRSGAFHGPHLGLFNFIAQPDLHSCHGGRLVPEPGPVQAENVPAAIAALQGGDDNQGSPRAAIFKPQLGKPAEEDLQNWGHHSTMDTVPDAVMQQIGGEHVSFVFSCQVRPCLPA